MTLILQETWSVDLPDFLFAFWTKKRSGAGALFPSTADQQYEGKAIKRNAGLCLLLSGVGVSKVNKTHKCPVVQAVTEADPANLPAVRNAQGGRLHGQVLRDSQRRRQLRWRGFSLRAGGKSIGSKYLGKVLFARKLFWPFGWSTARLESLSGVGHRRQGDSPAHTEERSGEQTGLFLCVFFRQMNMLLMQTFKILVNLKWPWIDVIYKRGICLFLFSYFDGSISRLSLSLSCSVSLWCCRS